MKLDSPQSAVSRALSSEKITGPKKQKSGPLSDLGGFAIYRRDGVGGNEKGRERYECRVDGSGVPRGGGCDLCIGAGHGFVCCPCSRMYHVVVSLYSKSLGSHASTLNVSLGSLLI